MMPSIDELKRLAHGVPFKDACTVTPCQQCDFSKEESPCRILAREELKKRGVGK